MTARRDLVDRAVTTLGADAARAPALAAFVDRVAAWNTKMDLTAARGDAELVDLMLADALVLARHLPEGARVVDVGSGAGAPGLPLAIARPDLVVTLVEPLQKRVSFLRTTIGALFPAGSARPAVVRGRGEDQRGTRFDVAISRATLPPPAWLALALELAPEAWVLLARDEPPASPDARATLDERYRWPLTGAERRVVRFVQGGEPAP